MTVTIWHNPRCSKSRETLALLRAEGVEPTIRLYLEAPPDLTELTEALARLGGPATGLARRSEAAYLALNLPEGVDDQTLLAHLAADPRLIERPLVMTDSRAAIGRPPEAVLALLDPPLA